MIYDPGPAPNPMPVAGRFPGADSCQGRALPSAADVEISAIFGFGIIDKSDAELQPIRGTDPTFPKVM
jgi:hypothetical protein